MEPITRTRRIRGIDYLEDAAGILVPATLVREAASIRQPAQLLPLLSSERVAEQEHFVVFTLDAFNKIIGKHVVTKGLVNQSQVHPRECYRPALKDNAVSIMVAHNHPSGNLDASANDLMATRRLAEAGRVMGIPLIDHIIVAASGFVSLRERFPDYFTGRKSDTE